MAWSKTPRTRGRTLQTIRARHFAEHPLCMVCIAKHKVRLAVELDHIVPLYKGGEDVESNRQGLCVSCHADKTRGDMGWGQKQSIAADGWPIEADK